MRVPVKGAELYCSARGEGPACLVPSAIGTKPYERLVAPPVSDRLRLVFVDLRGGGESTGEPTDLTFDVLADDLDAVRARLGIERIAVLGHSMLGMLAIEYGRRRPDRVSHVIAVGTPPTGNVAGEAAIGAAFFEEDASDERKRQLRENLAALSAGATPGQKMLAQTPMRFFDPRLDAAPLFAESVVRPRLLGHLLGTLAPAWDVTAGAASLRVPILVAHGRCDYVVPYRLWDGVVQQVPGATFRLFERSGHQPFFDEPDRFAEVVTDWMGN